MTRKKTGQDSSEAKAKKMKTSIKQTAKEKKLCAELEKVLALLDEEGLEFLLEQARIHLYNMEVERKNAEILSEEENTANNVNKIKKLEIIRAEGSPNYHIICNGKYSIFNEDEMLDIIRICHADEKPLEIKSRLYHWFFTERRDFLANSGIVFEDLEFDMLIEKVQKQFKLILSKR